VEKIDMNFKNKINIEGVNLWMKDLKEFLMTLKTQ
jgi:hypothetical protein